MIVAVVYAAIGVRENRLDAPVETHWTAKVISIRVVPIETPAGVTGEAFATVRHPNGHEGEVMLMSWAMIHVGDEIEVHLAPSRNPITGETTTVFIGRPKPIR